MKIADNILAYIRANGIQQKIIVDKCGWSKQKSLQHAPRNQ